MAMQVMGDTAAWMSGRRSEMGHVARGFEKLAGIFEDQGGVSFGGKEAYRKTL
jgi:hypothetical protein